MSAAHLEHLNAKSIKNSKIISLPNIGGVRPATVNHARDNVEPGTSKSESGLKLTIDSIAEINGNYDEEDEEDDDFGDEEIDDFFDESAVIQSAAAIMDRGEKKLYNKLRPNEWNAKVVSTPNIWHKD